VSDITRLPRWAQNHIRDLEMRLDSAVRAMNQAYEQSPEKAPFIVHRNACVKAGGPVTLTQRVEGYSMEVAHAGIELNVMLRDDHISLQYHPPRKWIAHIALVPQSFQQVGLYTLDALRSR
jgi:hypothetical protein